MTALFKEHYFETIELLSKEQREQIKHNNKDYIVIDVQCTNNGAWINLNLTNDFPNEDFINGTCSVFDNEDFINGTCSVFDNEGFEDLIDSYEYKTNKKFYN